MSSEREPQIAQNANQTRGVRRLPPRLGRPNPFGVQWGEQVWDAALNRLRRRVRTEFFPTEAARDARFAQLCRDKRAGQLNTASREELAEWRAFQIATEGTKWQDVVAGWRAFLQTQGLEVNPRTVEECAKDYLARYAKRQEAGQRSLLGFKKVERHVSKFAASFGGARISDITADDVEDWIDELETVSSPATFNSYRRDLRAFFEREVERGTLRRNPVDGVKLRDDLTETGLLSVDETARLLHTCRTFRDGSNGFRFHRIFARIVLETFAGLRTSAAARLDKGDINFEDKGITLPRPKTKNRRRHYVTGYPEVLWEWLALATPEAWQPCDVRELRYLKSELFRLAGVPHPHNCLRHGFASYLLAVKKDPGLLAYLLTHRSQDELWDHYNGRVTEKEAKRWERLTPNVAARIARQAAPPPGAP